MSRWVANGVTRGRDGARKCAVCAVWHCLSGVQQFVDASISVSLSDLDCVQLQQKAGVQAYSDEVTFALRALSIT